MIELIGPPPTAIESDALRDDGYVVLEGVLSRAAARELADAFGRLLATRARGPARSSATSSRRGSARPPTTSLIWPARTRAF